MSYVHDQMLSPITGAKMPKEAWENLTKIFVARTMAQKLQLQQELKNIWQRNIMSNIDYTTKSKEIYNALGSINVTVDEDEIV